ncbi:dTMP kinase [Thermodesulfobacterium sp. TA1]|uniref:dTMP kinase n=1 Tax=Thermodesulfobacterium sp. TA1 TaxID=2234087 RepID=UPI001231EBB4|nr:dTMP kinase [Thermodesulfobacterium sp. TA1]QER42492.1 dTMP kinase [Thermodesulfobacterium sp. TA1]
MFLNGPRAKLFITGEPGVGKTTLVEKLFRFFKKEIEPRFKLRGFITKEIREDSKRTGFKLLDLTSSKEFLFAKRKDLVVGSKDLDKFPTIGSYVVFLEGLEVLLDENKKEIDNDKVFWLIDEIGKMEALSPKFCRFIEKILGSSQFLLATIGKGEDPFLKKIWSFTPALRCELTPENRDFLAERLKVEFKRKGRLIVFEGIDGSGKTTLSKLLVKALENLGIKVFWGCEPTIEGPFGKVLREKLQKKEASPLELKELFLKDRFWNVKHVVLPKLNEGVWVVLDRYYLSTLSYQGAQGFDLKGLLLENETIAPLPDLVVYLDLSIEEALKRLKDTRENLTFFEKTEFLVKVRKNYLNLLPWFNHLTLEATKPLEENLNYLLEFLHRKFKSSFS